MPRPYVLIAEDYPDFRERLVELLQPLGLEIVAVKDGEEAITILQDMNQPIDLLITDLTMPRRNGWDVISIARATRGEHLPIIMQTGEAVYYDVRWQAEGQGVALLDKGYVTEKLLPMVKERLGL
ncbi:MAG TPA: response regulator [Dehalococcoidia bacterium]|nr:response regulator [Dehalococcoidia bacterium]HLB29781.1 response regulator [Dehalococcoidia bacterium]